MELVRLPAEEAAVRRWAEDLWLPYHRELERTVAAHHLAEDVDLVAAEIPFRLDLLDSEDYRAWVAVDPGVDEGSLADTDGVFAGFITTSVEECPAVFDRPDRLQIGDVYVREAYRGYGLADRLVDRARERARACGCPEFTLEVDVGNERALAFYERLGFEPRQYTMVAAVDG